MATVILRDTYRALEEEMKSLDKLKRETSLKIREAASHGDLLDLYPLIVTYHSPFGQAIIGKKIDEDFTLEIEGNETKFTITAIEKISAESRSI